MERKLNIILPVVLILLFVCTPATAGDKLSGKAENTPTGQIEGEKNVFEYNPKGKLDPFANLFLEQPAVDSQPLGSEPIADCPKGAVLPELDFGQLNLIGIILTSNGKRALFQEASGKGHIITKDMCVGKNRSKVATILLDKVILEEKMQDTGSGKISIRRKEIVVHTPAR